MEKDKVLNKTMGELLKIGRAVVQEWYPPGRDFKGHLREEMSQPCRTLGQVSLTEGTTSVKG